MRKGTVFFTVLALFLTLTSAHAAVRLINVLRIGPTTARHAVPVRNCAAGLTHVRLDVAVSSIFVERMGARFADGREIAMPMNKSFPVGAGAWTDISPARNLGCITQVFAIARSETRATARINAYGNFQ